MAWDWLIERTGKLLFHSSHGIPGISNRNIWSNGKRPKIPSFLKGRKTLSAAEEMETRRIAKARIHVERFNECLKQFKLVGRKKPLSLVPLATQMVVVASCLVNFQNTLCK